MRTIQSLATALSLLAGALITLVPAGATTGAASSLECATRVVAAWPIARQAAETIVVPVDAMHLGAMVPAARAGYGGLILFGASGSPVMASTLRALQRMTPAPYPMLVMTDEEGGGVRRLENLVVPFPWPQDMGRTMSPSRIATVGATVGAQLESLGVNTDLAPVADLDARQVWPGATNPDGLRSFGAAPLKAALDVAAFARGLGSSGVVAVVKHFPGLGGSTSNTDYGPAATKPWSVLETGALLPFERAIAAGAPVVMLSNATVPGLSTLPAGLSAPVVAALRGQLGFQGMIMTDSLSAGAIGALGLSVPTAAVRALAAGADQVLFGGSTSPAGALALAQSVSSAIQRAVAQGTLGATTLTSAAARVLVVQALAAHVTLACPAPTTPAGTSNTTTTATSQG